METWLWPLAKGEETFNKKKSHLGYQVTPRPAPQVKATHLFSGLREGPFPNLITNALGFRRKESNSKSRILSKNMKKGRARGRDKDVDHHIFINNKPRYKSPTAAQIVFTKE